METQLEPNKFYVYAEYISNCQCCSSREQFEEWDTIEQVQDYVAALKDQGFTEFTIIEGHERGLHD